MTCSTQTPAWTQKSGWRDREWIERDPSEGEDYLARASATVRVVRGYSVMHVAGRFREPSQERNVRANAVSDQKYLIDETTAVVRFIIPVMQQGG
jgi:hypothetical protein